MTGPRILHLETATNVCSVALSEGSSLLALRETDEDRSHGTVLTVFMQEVLDEAGCKAADVDAISISKGPGSYTGLRIGVSVTKGFAFARGIPVIGIPTLRLLYHAAAQDPRLPEIQGGNDELLFCPLIDARRMEVYTALFSSRDEEIEAVSAKIIDEDSYSGYLDNKKILFFGNGSDKIKGIITHPNALFLPGIIPSAKHMLPIALKAFKEKNFEDTAYFEPFYLKDFIATIPKKKMF